MNAHGQTPLALTLATAKKLTLEFISSAVVLLFMSAQSSHIISVVISAALSSQLDPAQPIMSLSLCLCQQMTF